MAGGSGAAASASGGGPRCTPSCAHPPPLGPQEPGPALGQRRGRWCVPSASEATCCRSPRATAALWDTEPVSRPGPGRPAPLPQPCPRSLLPSPAGQSPSAGREPLPCSFIFASSKPNWGSDSRTLHSGENKSQKPQPQFPAFTVEPRRAEPARIWSAQVSQAPEQWRSGRAAPGRGAWGGAGDGVRGGGSRVCGSFRQGAGSAPASPGTRPNMPLKGTASDKGKKGMRALSVDPARARTGHQAGDQASSKGRGPGLGWGCPGLRAPGPPAPTCVCELLRKAPPSPSFNRSLSMVGFPP